MVVVWSEEGGREGGGGYVCMVVEREGGGEGAEEGRGRRAEVRLLLLVEVVVVCGRREDGFEESDDAHRHAQTVVTARGWHSLRPVPTWKGRDVPSGCVRTAGEGADVFPVSVGRREKTFLGEQGPHLRTSLHFVCEVAL